MHETAIPMVRMLHTCLARQRFTLTRPQTVGSARTSFPCGERCSGSPNPAKAVLQDGYRHIYLGLKVGRVARGKTFEPHLPVNVNFLSLLTASCATWQCFTLTRPQTVGSARTSFPCGERCSGSPNPAKAVLPCGRESLAMTSRSQKWWTRSLAHVEAWLKSLVALASMW